jgi:hypothetical protein
LRAVQVPERLANAAASPNKDEFARSLDDARKANRAVVAAAMPPHDRLLGATGDIDKVSRR